MGFMVFVSGLLSDLISQNRLAEITLEKIRAIELGITNARLAGPNCCQIDEPAPELKNRCSCNPVTASPFRYAAELPQHGFARRNPPG